MRQSYDQYQNGRLINGFDYGFQAWVKDGKFVRCGHAEAIPCNCYGRLHAGEETKPQFLTDDQGSILGYQAFAGALLALGVFALSHGAAALAVQFFTGWR